MYIEYIYIYIYIHYHLCERSLARDAVGVPVGPQGQNIARHKIVHWCYYCCFFSL